MRIDEIFLQAHKHYYPIDSLHVSLGYYVANRYAIMSISIVESELMPGSDIEIYDESENSIGVLCIRNESSISQEECPLPRYIAYLFDVPIEDFLDDQTTIQLRNNYLMLDVNFLDEYLKHYRKTSFLWGGFVHKEEAVRHVPRTKKNLEKITIESRYKLPTSKHEEVGVRAIMQYSGFERFLKLYHLLEIDFNLFVVNKVRQLPENLDGFEHIFSRVSTSNELNRLVHIFEDTSFDSAQLKALLDHCFSHKEILKKFFKTYYKSDSAIALEQVDFMLNCNKTQDLINKYFKSKERQFLCKFSANLIYRTRSSIAHTKLGEHLFSPADENYVTNFAEPLIKFWLYAKYKT